MALLFSVIDFPELSRMSGIWTNSTIDADFGDEVVLAQLVVFPPDQDGVVESDFLCSHLPFQVGGFHGVFPDGQGWMVVLMKAPASSSTDLMSAGDPHWVLVDSIDRALRFNYGAEALDWVAWTREDLEYYYSEVGADPEVVGEWTVAELLWGLLSECCNVPLVDVVDGYRTGCAFPDTEHDCQGQVFTDVFAMWTTRALNAPEPDLDEIFGPVPDDEGAPEFTRWKRKKLKKLKRRELMRMAIADGWEWSDLNGVPKKVLITLMIDGQTRPPGVP
jgi:hypothetical protein